MNITSYSGTSGARRQRGFSLVELMVTLLIGLLVAAAAGTIFISNRQTYAATETMGRMQENGRIAFELMARELREAGATPCGNNIPIANVLKNTGAAGEFAWGDGLRGYEAGEAAAQAPFGAAAGNRVAGTQAVEFRSAGTSSVTVTKHNPASATIFTNTTDHGFVAGDILIVCDYSQGAIFQMSGPNAGGTLQIVHNTGNNQTPGNLCKALSFPVDPDCEAKPKDGKQYADNASVARLSSTIWYIGHNGRGGRSLYRRSTGRDPEEVTEGIQALDLRYLLPGTNQYTASIPVARWSEVSAVRIGLTLQAAEGALVNREIQGTDGQALTRQMAHVVTIRGRNP